MRKAQEHPAPTAGKAAVACGNQPSGRALFELGTSCEMFVCQQVANHRSRDGSIEAKCRGDDAGKHE